MQLEDDSRKVTRNMVQCLVHDVKEELGDHLQLSDL